MSFQGAVPTLVDPIQRICGVPSLRADRRNGIGYAPELEYVFFQHSEIEELRISGFPRENRRIRIPDAYPSIGPQDEDVVMKRPSISGGEVAILEPLVASRMMTNSSISNNIRSAGKERIFS